jgi:6-pyruvoyl-tetrahydropterin synthase
MVDRPFLYGGTVLHFTTVSAVFDAPHRVPGHSICGENHAHRWTISVTTEGGLDPRKILVVDHGEFQAALDAIAGELRNRDLTDMLPGVTTTPEGLALYVQERLILNWPRLVEVAVAMGDTVSVRVESKIR